RKKW
ncbi:hypothetical protein D046_3804B, partial [Vibrio parahaemolyticus V-223/04]